MLTQELMKSHICQTSLGMAKIENAKDFTQFLTNIADGFQFVVSGPRLSRFRQRLRDAKERQPVPGLF